MANPLPIIAGQEMKVTRASVLAYAEQVFTRADRDGDDCLSFEELQQFLSMFTHPYQTTDPNGPEA